MKLQIILSLMLASTSLLAISHAKHALGLIARRKAMLESYKKHVQDLQKMNAAIRPPCTKQELVETDLAILDTHLAGLTTTHYFNLLDLELYIGRIIAEDEKLQKKKGKQL
jgi:hypothetical protein